MFQPNDVVSRNRGLAAGLALGGVTFLSGCVSTRSTEYDPAMLAQTQFAGIPEPLKFETTKQKGVRECVTAVIYSVLHHFNPDCTLTYPQILAGLHDPRFKDLNDGDYISWKTIETYINEVVPSQERGGRQLTFIQLDSTDQLAETLKAGDPVIIPIMSRTFDPDLAERIDNWMPAPIMEAASGGERYVVPKYLHLVTPLSACKAPTGETYFLVGDPWAGIPFLSDAAPRIDTVSASELRARWLHLDNPDIRSDAARKNWEEEMWPRFSKLALPGMAGVFRPESPQLAQGM